MAITLNPIAQLDTSTATFKDLKINFDLLAANQITLKDYVCTLESLLGSLTDLDTTTQVSIVDAINELHSSIAANNANLLLQIGSITSNLRYESLTNNGNGTFTFNNDNGGLTTFDLRDTAIPVNGTIAGLSATNVHAALAELQADINGLSGGPAIGYATTTVPGIVELATSAEAAARTDNTRAITSALLAQETGKISPCDAVAAVGSELSGLTGNENVITCIGGAPRAVPFSTLALAGGSGVNLNPCTNTQITPAELPYFGPADRVTVCLGGGLVRNAALYEFIQASPTLIASGNANESQLRTTNNGAVPNPYFLDGGYYYIDTGIPTLARAAGQLNDPRGYIPVVQEIDTWVIGDTGDNDAAWYWDTDIVHMTRWSGPHNIHIRIKWVGIDAAGITANGGFAWQLWRTF